MRYLTLDEVIEIYRRIIEQSGGSAGIANQGGLESALAQPRMSLAVKSFTRRLLTKLRLLDFP